MDQQTAIIELAHILEALLWHQRYGPPETDDVYSDLRQRLFQIQTTVQPDTVTDDGA